VLCPAIKILERLLLPILEQHLPNSNIQHGFHRGHSTTSALLELNSTISSGFNQQRPPCRTLLLQIDLTFDRVNHEKLFLADLNNSSLPGAIVKWFNHGHQSRTLFHNCLSSSCNIHTGVTQGAVTSQNLFNFYLYNLPPPPAGVDIVMYADDLSAYAVGPEVQILCDRINTYVPVLLQLFQERDLVVSSEKSSVTMFTPQPNQAREHPQISINGTIIPLEKQPKILGVTHDTMYTFTPHCRIQAAKVRARNNLLEALAGTFWGQQQETLILTYQARGRSVIDYAAPVWAPVINDSTWKYLQTAQSEGLRIVTGCHKMSHTDQLYVETKLSPVKYHSELLAKQYWLSCYQSHHPCHHLTTLPAPARNVKGTLKKFNSEVIPLSDEGITDVDTNRDCLRTLQSQQSQAVVEAKANFVPNRVLGASPSDISPLESLLTRRVLDRLKRVDVRTSG